MTKYEIFDYEVWKNGEEDYSIDVCESEGNFCINYAGMPYCELHAID